MIKLSKRLDAISSLVPINANIIDIGCDHALLDIYLYQNNISHNIIASDINNNALDNARKNIKANNLEREIDIRLGNGLDTLGENDKIDTIIISGIGAHTIVGILKNNRPKLENIDTIIIQSNTKLMFLRKEITKLNYMISDEVMVEDSKKIYTIIKFTKGSKKYSNKELYFGPILLKKNEKILENYIKKEYDKLNILLKLLPKNKFIDRYRLKKELALYKNIIK